MTAALEKYLQKVGDNIIKNRPILIVPAKYKGAFYFLYDSLRNENVDEYKVDLGQFTGVYSETYIFDGHKWCFSFEGDQPIECEVFKL